MWKYYHVADWDRTHDFTIKSLVTVPRTYQNRPYFGQQNPRKDLWKFDVTDFRSIFVTSLLHRTFPSIFSNEPEQCSILLC